MAYGIGTREEIERSIAAAAGGCEQLALLSCTSAYPAPVGSGRLRGIRDLRGWSGREGGHSDHTLDRTVVCASVAVVSVAPGATTIEEHVVLGRALEKVCGSCWLDQEDPGSMVRESREAWNALGEVAYGPSASEVASLRFRRDLYFIRDRAAGEVVRPDDIGSFRPTADLDQDQAGSVVGRRLTASVARGDAVRWDQFA